MNSRPIFLPPRTSQRDHGYQTVCIMGRSTDHCTGAPRRASMQPCAACQLGILSTYRERKNGSYHRHTVPHTRVYLYIPHNTWCPRDTLQNQRSTAPVCAHVGCSRSQPRVMQGTIEAAPIQTTRTLRHIAPSPQTHSHPHHPSLGASAHRLLKSKSNTEKKKGKREKGKKGNSKNFGKVYFYAPQNY